MSGWGEWPELYKLYLIKSYQKVKFDSKNKKDKRNLAIERFKRKFPEYKGWIPSPDTLHRILKKMKGKEMTDDKREFSGRKPTVNTEETRSALSSVASSSPYLSFNALSKIVECSAPTVSKILKKTGVQEI